MSDYMHRIEVLLASTRPLLALVVPQTGPNPGSCGYLCGLAAPDSMCDHRSASK